MKNKAIFFDRDGVVNFRPVGDYVREYNEFKFIPDFFEFFKKIKSQGYLAIIISNQQGVGKGLMSETELSDINHSMQKELMQQTGFSFDDIFICVDLAESGSFRRKPNPGMMIEAIAKWNIDIESSWMIGDSENDIIAGKKANVRTILLKPDYLKNQSAADLICSGLSEIIF